MPTRTQLQKRIQGFIAARSQAGLRADGSAFEALALELFAYQYGANEPYRRFCTALGRDPQRVRHWSDIPAMPTVGFRELPLCCFPVDQATGWFATSGTTGPESGRHYYRDLTLYDRSWAGTFKPMLLPELERMRVVALVPPWRNAPHSSLAFMVERAIDRYGTRDSTWAWDEGRNGPAVERVAELLREIEGRREPVLLLGTAFAWVLFLDWAGQRDLAWRLPAGSRLMETGGYKGRSREVPREEFRRLLVESLGLPPVAIVGEYGMTELGSQFYEPSLSLGQPTDFKAPNPWAAVAVMDPYSGNVMTPASAPVQGCRGLVRVFDLANLDSVMAVQTEDVATLLPSGSFRLEGRAAGAAARGCSLDVDAYAAASGAGSEA